jgi:hypothetical protein
MWEVLEVVELVNLPKEDVRKKNRFVRLVRRLDGIVRYSLFYKWVDVVWYRRFISSFEFWDWGWKWVGWEGLGNERFRDDYWKETEEYKLFIVVIDVGKRVGEDVFVVTSGRRKRVRRQNVPKSSEKAKSGKGTEKEQDIPLSIDESKPVTELDTASQSIAVKEQKVIFQVFMAYIQKTPVNDSASGKPSSPSRTSNV